VPRRLDRESVSIVSGAPQEPAFARGGGRRAGGSYGLGIGEQHTIDHRSLQFRAPRESKRRDGVCQVGRRHAARARRVAGRTHPPCEPMRDVGVTGAAAAMRVHVVWGHRPPEIRLSRVIRDPEGHDPEVIRELGCGGGRGRVRPRAHVRRDIARVSSRRARSNTALGGDEESACHSPIYHFDRLAAAFRQRHVVCDEQDRHAVVAVEPL